MGSTNHVFISYKREDQEFARHVRTALKALGFEVWWDEEIQAGETWSETLDNALLEASAILVLWSDRSIGSDWVKHEASIAKFNDKLVQVCIDGSIAPDPFGSVMCGNLEDWKKSEDEPVFRKLAGALQRIQKTPEQPAGHRVAKVVAGLLAIVVIAMFIHSRQLNVELASLNERYQQLVRDCPIEDPCTSLPWPDRPISCPQG